MTGVVVAHRLSLVIRFRDHFSGAPVADELPLRLEGSLAAPVSGPLGPRQLDGTYRFLNLPPGQHRLLWRRPFARSEAGWTRWSEPDPVISLPRPDPLTPSEIELWPTAAATTPAGTTGLRGKLRGTGNAGAIIRVAHTAVPNDRHAVADAEGEFLFPLPGAAPPGPGGLVPLILNVTEADGTPRDLLPPGGGAAVPSLNLTIRPREVARVQIELA